jgi:hypothetical protein
VCASPTLLGTKTLLEKTNSLEADRMRQKFIAVLVLLVAIVAVGLAGLAQDTPTEAPAGFDTPTLVQNPGSQSHSNGIAQPAGDTYANDQRVYETTHDPSTGLGPVFNARACSDCHQNPVSGGASQFTEPRAGHRDANGNFVNPTIPINDGANNVGKHLPHGDHRHGQAAHRPVVGFRMRPRFKHDLRWLSLQNAIERHASEAEHVRQGFQELSPVEKQPLFSFLNSL